MVTLTLVNLRAHWQMHPDVARGMECLHVLPYARAKQDDVPVHDIKEDAHEGRNRGNLQ